MILHVRDVLYSLKSAPIKYAVIEDLLTKTHSVHHGFRDPLLDKHFVSGEIKNRVENSGLMMLKSILVQVTDAAVINHSFARWTLKSHPALRAQLVVSERDAGSFEYRIMFNKNWQDYVNLFYAELAQMKRMVILKKYWLDMNNLELIDKRSTAALIYVRD